MVRYIQRKRRIERLLNRYGLTSFRFRRSMIFVPGL